MHSCIVERTCENREPEFVTDVLCATVCRYHSIRVLSFEASELRGRLFLALASDFALILVLPPSLSNRIADNSAAQISCARSLLPVVSVRRASDHKLSEVRRSFPLLHCTFHSVRLFSMIST